MGFSIVKGEEVKAYTGCDYVVRLPSNRRNTKIKILQITDTQIIDASQRRTPECLRTDEITAWAPNNFDAQCGNHVRSLVAQTRPDLIIITGDIIYGSFDDKGTTLDWFCNLMDSFKIPWAPTFGNHDNESEIGVSAQCKRLSVSKYCLFSRGNVSGNSNYSVGIAIDDELIRVSHMVDSNGCRAGKDTSLIKERGIYPDQLDLIRKNTKLIRESQKKEIPAFMAFHIPIEEFKIAESKKGYLTAEREFYVIGVDVPALDSDFGFKQENYIPITTNGGYVNFLHENYINGVFVGHVHNNSTVIDYEGIKWVFGLKTGQYDYHIPGQLGGTLITLEGEAFSVAHVPALVRLAPMPGGASMFRDFFASNEIIS